MAQSFGEVLRVWRARRRMSQLDLSLTAEVSTRHLAFLETGRSQPSRAMVLQLAEALQAPFAARNEMLQAAGFAPHYRCRALDAAEMAQVEAALAWTLERHDPYPGLAFDRHWAVARANRAGARMLGALGLKVGDSFLEAIGTQRMRDCVENFPAVARHIASRLRTEIAHLGGDAALEAAARALAKEAAPFGEEEAQSPAVFPTRLRLGETRLAFFSTIAQFGTAEDIALADLKIELFFPADEETRLALIAGARV